MSKKQEISSKKTASEGKTYGNLDKEQKYEFPQAWADNPDVVVVFQEQIKEENGEKFTINGSGRVQVYDRSIFEVQYPTPDGAKENGFERLGLKVTPLNNPGVSETFENDEDLPAIPSADVALTAADQIKKETLEAAKEGETETPAEEFARRSQEKAEDEAGSVKIDEEAEAAKKETEAKKEDKPGKKGN